MEYSVENDIVDVGGNDDANVWTLKHEEIFINLMEEEVLKGNRCTTTFTKPAWKRIREKLCIIFMRLTFSPKLGTN